MRKNADHLNRLFYMCFYYAILLICELTLLFQDTVLNTDLANIMEQSCYLYSLDILLRKPELCRQLFCISGNIFRMLEVKESLASIAAIRAKIVGDT